MCRSAPRLGLDVLGAIVRGMQLMTASRMLVISTVAKSLVLQSPDSWTVANRLNLRLTFAASPDGWQGRLPKGAGFVPIRSSRRMSIGSIITASMDLWRLSRSGEWDLVQVQTPIVAGLWRIIAPRRIRGRTLYVAHGLHFQRGVNDVASWVYRTIESLLAHRCLAVAVVSKEDFQWLSGLPRVAAPRVRWRLPGAGVDTRAFSRPKEARNFSRPKEARDIPKPFALFCGDLNANKDPVAAVRAVEAFRNLREYDLGLVLIGEGDLGGEIRRMASSRPWLKMVPRTDDMVAWLQTTALLLAPSKREGVPRVILESLAAGTPIVARSNRGSRELLYGGVGEILSADDGPGSWAEAIDNVLKRPPSVIDMRSRAQLYDSRAFVTSYSELLQGLLRSIRR